ncbi:hypothetical protein FALBO_9313 [Fusarium albosuccineum]|uniref:Uncharacterized protein n=1 Tax=Fusarium albosuccineum TaxID=1237068 RepID=A0A8H4PC33_9HYPO|nr:hypothetical protein FALBO_9313 [Fusarium albosuccineum]
MAPTSEDKGKAVARLASLEPETPVSKSSSGSENQLPTPSTDIRNDAVSPSPDDDYDYSRDEEEEDSEDEFPTVGMDDELDDEFISVEPEDELDDEDEEDEIDDEDEEDKRNDEAPFLLAGKRLRSGKQPLAARKKPKKKQPMPLPPMNTSQTSTRSIYWSKEGTAAWYRLPRHQREITQRFRVILSHIPPEELTKNILSHMPRLSQKVIGKPDLMPVDLLDLPEVPQKLRHRPTYAGIPTRMPEGDLVYGPSKLTNARSVKRLRKGA